MRMIEDIPLVMNIPVERSHRPGKLMMIVIKLRALPSYSKSSSPQKVASLYYTVDNPRCSHLSPHLYYLPYFFPMLTLFLLFNNFLDCTVQPISVIGFRGFVVLQRPEQSLRHRFVLEYQD